MKGLVEPGTGINCKVCVYGSTCNTGRGHAYHVKSCVQYADGKPKTNADRIRSMSDEELALFLETTTEHGRVSEAEWRTWLKAEAEI